MAKSLRPRDFRKRRAYLRPFVFALGPAVWPEPTDPVAKDTWAEILHLADHVALITSDHHGSHLARLCTLWGDWIEAMSDDHDALFSCMLDAVDCLQGSAFDALHGYYRSAIANLHAALELVAIGALGNLSPADADYRRWSEKPVRSFPFSTCMKKLRAATRRRLEPSVFQENGWPDTLYDELCAYAHSRPDASDGAMWQSNGPIYVPCAFLDVFHLRVTTYAACYVFAKVGRLQLHVSEASETLFTNGDLLLQSEIASAYRAACTHQQLSAHGSRPKSR